MRLLFDIWAKYPKDHVYTQTEEIIFDTFYTYIYDRLYVLWDEIEKEETQNEKAAILVYLCTDIKAIIPTGYSKSLENKILNSFNENDVTLLWKSVEKALSSIHN